MSDLLITAITKEVIQLPCEQFDPIEEVLDSTINGVAIIAFNFAGVVADHTITILAPVSEVGTDNYGNLPVDDFEVTVPHSDQVIFRVPYGYADNGKLIMSCTSEEVCIGAVSANA